MAPVPVAKKDRAELAALKKEKAEHFQKLEKHARKFEERAHPEKAVAKYAEEVENADAETRATLATHVAAWCALARSSRCLNALTDAAELLKKMLETIQAPPQRLLFALEEVQSAAKRMDNPAWNALRVAVEEKLSKPAAPVQKATSAAKATSGAEKGGSGVCVRKLKRCWSEAKADGKKWFESTVSNVNPLKQFKGGDYMVFGSQGDGNLVDGIAIIKGAPVYSSVDRTVVHQRLMLGAEGAKQLDEYIDSGATGSKASESFDYLKFNAVFDLRRLNLSVEEFCQQLEVNAPTMYLGFPRIHGENVQPRIIEWLRQPDISVHILEEERFDGLWVRSAFFTPGRVVDLRALRSGLSQLKREPAAFASKAESSLKAAVEASPADEKELHKALFSAVAALAGAPEAPQKRIRDLLIKAFETWRIGLSLGDEKILAALQFVRYLFEYFELFQQEVFEDEDVLQWVELKRIID